MGEADKLINKISECQRELAKIQDSCCHPKKEMKFIDIGEGVRWVCKDCKRLLGWPSDFDIKKWTNNL